MKKKQICFVLWMLTILCLLTGCNDFMKTENGNINGGVADTEALTQEDAQTKQKEIHIFISSPEYAEAFQNLIDVYEESHQDIRIHYETTQNDYPTLLKVRMNSGNIPDIFSTTTGKEIDIYRDWSYDLTGQPLAETMLPTVADLMKSPETGTGLYGVALKDNYFGLIYNKRILKEAGIVKYPETISQMEEACAKLSSLGYQPFTTGYNEWWVYKHICQHFLAAAADSAGTSVAEIIEKLENGEVTVEDYKELSDNLYQFLDLTVTYGGSSPEKTTLSDEISAFANETAVIMAGQGAWVESDILKENESMELGFYGYPVSEDASQCRIITGADQALRVNKDSKVLDEVLEFINWWYTSEYGIQWFTDVACVASPVISNKESDSQIITQGKRLSQEQGTATLGICYSSDQLYEQVGEILGGYIDGRETKQSANERLLALWPEIDGKR